MQDSAIPLSLGNRSFGHLRNRPQTMLQCSTGLLPGAVVVGLVVFHSVLYMCVSGLDDDGDLKGNYFGTLYIFQNRSYG